MFSSWDDHTVVELKQSCKDRGLSSTGVKAQLIERLEAFERGEEAEVSPRVRSRSASKKRNTATTNEEVASPRKSTTPRGSSKKKKQEDQQHQEKDVTTPTSGSKKKRGQQREEEEEAIEFGGAFGAAFIMLASHATLYYLWISWKFYGAQLTYPSGVSDTLPWLQRMWQHIATGAAPNWEAALTYGAFIVMQAGLAVIIPGLKMRGLPVKHLGGIRLEYNCNGIWTWYATLIIMAALHFTGTWRLSSVYHNFGPLMTVAMLTQDAISIITYVGAFITKTTHRMSGNHVYDFFMGAPLHPRLGPLDLKMWAEVREAWVLLFLLTCSAAAHQYEVIGRVTPQMWFMILAHFLYTNACHKGEECIPTTWDIFHEKWGWMLIFWNGAGVPYVYCFQSWFIATHDPQDIYVPNWAVLALTVWLLTAYYFWDTIQRQRNSFRMKLNGSFVPRYTFPYFPAGIINPETASYIKTKTGSLLLTDGLWAYGRKLHYTADVAMALSWGLICGFTHILPYFYCFFFLLMITHRTTRDIARCEKKYGDDWVRYKQAVPWLFIPYVF